MPEQDHATTTKTKIKELLVEDLMLELSPEEIGDDTPLFGPEGLGLDSVDALQLIVSVEKNFGLKFDEQEAAREALQSVNTIAALIPPPLPG
jgi:acyl carrier protein